MYENVLDLSRLHNYMSEWITKCANLNFLIYKMRSVILPFWENQVG